MSTIIIIIASIVLVVIIIAAIVKNLIETYRHEATIWQHQVGLHFHEGRLVEQLKAGKHRFWGQGHIVTPFDTRKQEIVVQGQEVITADKATVKVTAVLIYRIADAAKLFSAAGDPAQALYTSVQLALREIVGSEEIDKFIENKSSFGKALRERVAATAAELGVTVDCVEIRDVILGGELKTVYTGVLRARKEALAELEKARGESAALRTMANASRVFENNPALLQLRYLQSLEQMTAGSSGNTIVLGSPEDLILQQLKKG